MSRFTTGTLVSAIAALGIAAAVPGAASATGDAGMWKVNPARSRVNSESVPHGNTLTVERGTMADANESAADRNMMVVHKGNLYLTTAETAKELLIGKRVSPNRMTRIGVDVRSNELCGFRCQSGQSERRRTFSFTMTGAQQKTFAFASGKQ